MYKVFFNDRKIIITQKPDITIRKTIKSEVELGTTKDVKRWFSEFADDNTKEIYITNDNPEYFWKNVFIPSFKFIKAAGGVVIRNSKMLVIYRNGKWDLPKGKIDKGETIENAAVREVEEECGISGHSIVKKLPSTFHIYQSPRKKSKHKWILKETFWYEMEYNGSDNGTPQTEENITLISWCEKSDLNELLDNTYENLKQIILLYSD